MLTTYGVEAARATILKEVQVRGMPGVSVFGAMAMHKHDGHSRCMRRMTCQQSLLWCVVHVGSK
jgi:hypothetical protein